MEPVRSPDGRVVLDVWLADYPFRTYDGRDFLAPMRRFAAEFEKAHPEYRVDITGHDFWTMPQKVAAAAESGRTPVLAAYYAGDTQEARDARAADGTPLFTPVGRALAGRAEILGEPVAVHDLVPAVRDFYTCGGELCSVPVTATTLLLYANTTLLEAAGVSALPTTWEELRQACAAVVRAPEGASHGITWANDGWVFQQAVALQGGLLAVPGNGRTGRATSVDLSSPHLLEWVRWWAGLHADGLYLYTGSPSDWGGAFGAFAQQRVAFTLDSSKAAEDLVRCGGQAGFDVAVCPMPAADRAPRAGNPVSGDSLWLAAGLDRATEDGALAFTQFLINPRNAAEWHRANGFVPVTESAAALLEEEGWFAGRPHQRVAAEQLRAADGSVAALGPLVGGLADIGEIMTGAMDDVLLRGADPVERFTRASARAQEVLDGRLRAHGEPAAAPA